MRTPQGRLLRTTSAGAEAKLNGYLEDYAYLMDALVSLYQATFEARWLVEAVRLADILAEQFWDEAEGGFFYTSTDHESLIARNKDPHDNATPSGNAMAVTALLRLAHLTGRDDLRAKAERTLRLFQGLLSSSPLAAGQMLIALDFHLGPVQEVVVLGDRASETYRQALRAVHGAYRPNQVVAGPSRDGPSPAAALLEGREARGDVTVYACRDGTCQAPVTDVAALTALLG